jgi:transcriptional regulator with XRE-family HTH domain|nr:MAG: helix-turn-helix domain protein [Bacteriophage sp.]UVX80443.1 MAG: helix-turn-helix domain protein [Bacteriophage sp.]DAX12428.1 MAG TPA: helix-turn-helix domain protein [Caudoviricetes sp.]
MMLHPILLRQFLLSGRKNTMLNARDLKEYRLLHGLSQRDVAMYCNVSYRLIGEVENGQKNLTDFNYHEIIKGINSAVQAKARGTFEEDKKKFNEKENEYERNRIAQKKAEEKIATKKKSTRSSSSRTVESEPK